MCIAADQGNEQPDPGPAAARWHELGRFDEELRGAFSRKDAAAMALLVKFPLKLNYPDDSVILLANPRALQTHFEEAFPLSLREAVIHDTDGAIWRDIDVGIANGTLWASLTDSEPNRYLIHTVNLPDLEKSPEKKEDATIEFVCETAKHRIVIDKDSSGKHKYRAWNKPRFLPDKPDMEIGNGTMDISGTQRCSGFTWSFSKGDTTFAIGELGCAEVPKDATGELQVLIDNEVRETLWCL